MRSVRGATKKSQPPKGTRSTKMKFLLCDFCALLWLKEKGGLLKTGSRKTALFEEPTYLACSNANTPK
jgi:hypothetical protein